MPVHQEQQRPIQQYVAEAIEENEISPATTQGYQMQSDISRGNQPDRNVPVFNPSTFQGNNQEDQRAITLSQDHDSSA